MSTSAEPPEELAAELGEQWDPRISPALKTTYAYDSADRVSP